MFRYLSFRLAVSLACFMLASCEVIQEKTTIEPAGWASLQTERQQIKQWEVRGRLGVQTEVTGGSLDVIWKQAGENYSIRLLMPLGAGNYLVQGDNRSAQIRYPNGRKKAIYNIDKVFSSTLGIDLPVSAIKDWIRGLPARSLPATNMKWNEQSLLSSVKQSGWNVEMSDYAGNKMLLPHAVYLSRDDNVEVDVRLVLRQWLVDD